MSVEYRKPVYYVNVKRRVKYIRDSDEKWTRSDRCRTKFNHQYWWCLWKFSNLCGW